MDGEIRWIDFNGAVMEPHKYACLTYNYEMDTSISLLRRLKSSTIKKLVVMMRCLQCSMYVHLFIFVSIFSVDLMRVDCFPHILLSFKPIRQRIYHRAVKILQSAKIITVDNTVNNKQPVVLEVRNNGENHQRRVKKNKYEQFSTQQVDPLLVAIEKAERDQLSLLMSHQSNNPVRGTTVPTIQASNNINTKLMKSKDDVSQLLLFRNSSSVVPSDPLTFGYIEIGMILGPHGVKGELKIQLESDFSELRASPGSILYVRKPNRRTPRAVQIVSSRKQSDNTYLVFLNQINSRLAALAFKRYVVYVKEEDRPALQDDEYLIRDVVGMLCYSYSDYQRVTTTTPHSEDNLSTITPIGVVVGIIPPDELCDTTFARLMHAQLELELFVQSNHHHQQQATNSESKKLLCMVPFVPSIVPVVDVANQCLFIDPPLGLLEMTYNEKPKRVVIRGYLPEFIDRLTDEAREYLRTRVTYS